MRAALVVLVAIPAILTGCMSTNPAMAAVDGGDMLSLRSIIDSGYDLNATVWNGNFTLLEYAACQGRDKAVKELLARGADLNKGHEFSRQYGVYYTPLSRAIQCNGSITHPSTVRLLLDSGAKVDPMSLAMVSRNYNDPSITEMVREAAELQAQGRSAARPSAAAQAEAVQDSAAANLQDATLRRRREDALIDKGVMAPRTGPDKLDEAIAAALAAKGVSPADAAALTAGKTGASSDVESPSARGAARPDDFALVIGIEGYQALPKAEWGERDAKTVRKHLEALGYPSRNIISLEGSQATASKLKSYLEEWLPLNVKETSTLFVYYSGHGAPDPKTGDAYLVPWDGDPQFLKTTALPLKTLYADLSKTKAKRVIVALDACFSGAGGRSVLAQGARPLVARVAEVKAPARVTVLAAASGDEIAGALPDRGHGMFTYFLLKALSEGKRGAKELVDYVSPRVQDEARRQNRLQTPALIGDDAAF